MSRSFTSCGKLVLLCILILMLMLVKHGLDFVHSLVRLLGQFTSKFIIHLLLAILTEIPHIKADRKDDDKQLRLLLQKQIHHHLKFLIRNLVATCQLLLKLCSLQSETAEKETECDKPNLANQATDGFSCDICDFKSNWANGLSIHIARKHCSIEQVDGIDDLKENDKYPDTCHYWKTGRLGTVFQTFIDVNEIIDTSNLSEVIKEIEKAKVLDARKCAFGENYAYVPPWNQKR